MSRDWVVSSMRMIPTPVPLLCYTTNWSVWVLHTLLCHTSGDYFLRSLPRPTAHPPTSRSHQQASFCTMFFRNRLTPKRLPSPLQGLRNLLAAFQDQRVALYGDPYSTKKTLFRFNRDVRDVD